MSRSQGAPHLMKGVPKSPRTPGLVSASGVPAKPTGERVAYTNGASDMKTPNDIRCPHCRVVILQKERWDARADRHGAPEFCPRCGERTEGDAAPGTPGSEGADD